MHLFEGDALDQLIRLALTEDVGAGDVTSESVVPETARGAAIAVAKSELVVCGIDVAARVFALLDPCVTFTAKVKDGDALSPGGFAFEIAGPLRSILTGERTALNFIQRLSGIATLTREASRALAGSKTRLLDTRKTAPGFRALEKRAVRAGGGHGHRTNLADGIMIKDNHIAAAGSIAEAVKRAQAFVHPLIKIEVEVKNLQEVSEAIAAGADMLLLDNMSNAQLTEAVQLVAGRIPTEASGNMSIDRLPSVAKTGVDYVSMGALTHSAPAADLSLAITHVKR
jgi:nicotinate-nucleotide pyrophosphorylase (carboxylating)